MLSLYGQLAAAMSPGTFVAGEAASVAPAPGLRERAMYLPPNGAANAAFLETLRLLLVHETADRLELAFSTPRAWLAPGRRIAVANAPTRFGPVVVRDRRAGAHGGRDGADRRGASSPRTLAIRLRLPAGARIRSVSLNGHRYARFDPATGTIELSGRAHRPPAGRPTALTASGLAFQSD